MNTDNIRFRSNRMRDIISLYHTELDAIYGAEVSVFVEMLCEAFLGWDRVRLLTGKEQTIDQSDLLRFHWALEDLKRHRPIQHIIGHTDFCGCRIEVNGNVLIPRPETEEMVNWTVQSGGRKVERALDLCTGSGCIAIALKRAYPQAVVTAADISPEALAVARRNAETNGAEVRFVEADVLSDDFNCQPTTFNLITANPPYVRESERNQMAPNVLEYDPGLALFVPDDDPLRFYRAIARVAARSLADDGLLVAEINEALADETCEVLKQCGLHPEVHTDFRGKARWVAARLE